MSRLRLYVWVLLALVGMGMVGFWWWGREARSVGGSPPVVSAPAAAAPAAAQAVAPVSSPASARSVPDPVAPREALVASAAVQAAPELVPLAYAQNWRGEQPSALAAFRDWTARYMAAAASARPALAAEGLALARARREEMKALMARDPRAALAATAPATVRSALPPAVVAELETRFSVVGDLNVMAVDYSPQELVRRRQLGLATETMQHFVRWEGGRSVRAYVYGRREGQTTKQAIPLHGIQLDDTVALHESALRALEPGEALPSVAPTDVGAMAAASASATLAEGGGRLYRFPSPAQVVQAEARLEAAESGIGPDKARSIDAVLLGLDSTGAEPQTAAAPVRPWTVGVKKVLVIRVDFSDRTGDPVRNGTPYTGTYVQNLMDTEIAPYFLQSSFGKTSLVSTVTPLYRMPRTSADYAVSTSGDDDLHTDARSAAATAGYTIADYDRIIVLFANLGGISGSKITWGGLALVGGRDAWVNGEFDFRIVAHELGHTFGVKHANLWKVTDGNPVSAFGTSDEYGDDFDTMGANDVNDRNTDFNPWFKNLLGWIADDQVQTVTGSGTYRVYRFDHASASASNKLALKIARDSTRTFWIGARRSFADNSAALHGAYVIWGYPNNSSDSDLIDIGTPGNNYKDAPLPVGTTLTDATGNLSLRLVSEGGVSPSEYIDVEVTLGLNGIPIVSVSPQSQGFVAGQTVTLSVTATGTPTLQYQWYKDGTLIPGATASTYVIVNAQLADVGSYTVRVTNTVGNTLSSAADLTLNSPSVISQQPVHLTVTAGLSAAFTVVASGSPAPAYQWRKDGVDISGATSATYTIASAQAEHVGSYSVVVSNTLATVESTAASLAVKTATTPPSNNNFASAWVLAGNAGVAKGSNSGATGQTGEPTHVNANGTASSVWYQWTPSISGNAQVDTIGSNFDTVLAVYTGSTLTALTKIGEDDQGGGGNTSKLFFTVTAGTTYQIAIGDWTATHVGGSITLNYVVAPPPSITTQPVNQTGSIGGSAVFSVGVAGAGSTYQWYHDGVAILGATAATLKLNSLTLADAGDYYVVVSGLSAAVVSAKARLSGPAAPPVITKQPQDVTDSIVYSVTATGSEPLSYQWRRNGQPLIHYTQPTAYFSSTEPGFYDVLVSSGLSVTASDVVRIARPPSPKPSLAVTSEAAGVRLESAAPIVNLVWPAAGGATYVAGDFTSINGEPRMRLARLLANGNVDTTFRSPDFDAEVYSIAVQADGKVVVGGAFIRANDAHRSYLVRLDVDGTLDDSFATLGMDSSVNVVALQSDGKILVGGAFGVYRDAIGGIASRARLARLNSDGTLDTGFNPGVNGSPYALVVQADKKILVGGNFTQIGGQARGYFARLNENGTLDTGYATGAGAGAAVRAIVPVADDKVLIGGAFSTYDGSTASRIARLNSAGALDGSLSFGTGFASSISTVYELAVQADGKILAGGSFASFRGTTRTNLARINADGTIDTTFAPAPDFPVYGITVSGSQIFVAGAFSEIAGVDRYGLARLASTGAIDGSFAPLVLSAGTVSAMLTMPNGKIYVGGTFSYANGVKLRAPNLVRLYFFGSDVLDPGFNIGTGPNASVLSLVRQADGKVLVGGAFTSYDGTARSRLARLSADDGVLDTTFPALGAGPNGTVTSIAEGPDGRVLLAGAFTTYHGVTRNRLARIGRDGSLDYTFNPGAGIGGATSPSIASLLVARDSKVLVGGNFTTVSGATRNYLARLLADGSVDPAFTGPALNGTVRALALQGDGQVLIGGDFSSDGATALARLKTDGSLDPGFALSNTPPVRSVFGILQQEDGNLFAVQTFTNASDAALTPNLARFGPTGVRDTTFWINPLSGRINTALLLSNGQFLLGGTYPLGVRLTGAPEPTSFLTQPSSGSVLVGDSITFSASATGTAVGPDGNPGFQYQWYKNDAPIPGATNSTYTISNVQAGDAGKYDVSVANIVSRSFSSTVELAVFPPGSVTHEVAREGYVAGGTVDIRVRIQPAGTMTDMKFAVLLPEGLSYRWMRGYVPTVSQSESLLELRFQGTSRNLDFTYTLNVPPGMTGPLELVGLVTLRGLSSPLQVTAKPDPLVIRPSPLHTADIDGNRAIDLYELTRVIEFYNTRFNTVRTGSYQVDLGAEDGFYVAPDRALTDVRALTHYHSADTDRNGRIDLDELTRVIDLYSTAAGTTRTGAYHPAPGTSEDGFAPGPQP